MKKNLVLTPESLIKTIEKIGFGKNHTYNNNKKPDTYVNSDSKAQNCNWAGKISDQREEIARSREELIRAFSKGNSGKVHRSR